MIKFSVRNKSSLGTSFRGIWSISNVDHKGMIDFASLEEKEIDISGFPSHATVTHNMGHSSPDQKKRFVCLPQGLKSLNDGLHLYNFDNIRNPIEKPALVEAVSNGAEDAGCTEGIAFINYE